MRPGPRVSPTQRKYRRIIDEKAPREELRKNEMRIRGTGSLFGVSVKIADLLLEEKLPTVEISGTGPAISRTATIVDFLRKRIQGLHVVMSVGNVEIIDKYEPIEEGLDIVTVKRNLAVLRVVLTLTPDAAQKAQAGYHAPLTVSEEEARKFEEARKNPAPRREGPGPVRRGGRGGPRRGPRQDEGEDRRGGSRGGERGGYERDERPRYRDSRYAGGSRRGGEERRDGGRREDRREDRGEDRRGERRDNRGGEDRRGEERRGEERRGGDRRDNRDNRDRRDNRDTRGEERRGGERRGEERRGEERRGEERRGGQGQGPDRRNQPRGGQAPRN